MEAEARRGVGRVRRRTIAVERVAEDGHGEAADGLGEGGVNAELVGAAGDGRELDAGANWRGGSKRLAREDAVAREGIAAVGFADHLARAVVPIDADLHADFAGVVRGGEDAVEERDVGLVDVAFFELAREVALGVGRECDGDDAAGFKVEAMDHHRAGGVGEAEADAGDNAVLLVLAAARNAEQA